MFLLLFPAMFVAALVLLGVLKIRTVARCAGCLLLIPCAMLGFFFLGLPIVAYLNHH